MGRIIADEKLTLVAVTHQIGPKCSVLSLVSKPILSLSAREGNWYAHVAQYMLWTGTKFMCMWV